MFDYFFHKNLKCASNGLKIVYYPLCFDGLYHEYKYMLEKKINGAGIRNF